ncbi:hypothetical protein C4D60_Mb04t30500 [Musa balbisiana]|uniref:Uncharacterized protein n=1 Tax=Musa balbisiana TaxID=52838 RepID=A0A4S8KGD4_MUSBA|nr:hypothetical protein C4D60_Mb04t30500 [Musa balbisiana]
MDEREGRCGLSLELAGMATKVQNKNYLPGYCSMQDIKEDATSGWYTYFQDKKSSEYLHESYVPKLVNGCSGQDKEMLKQMMLEHDTIFRNQVFELHRLYRIQKDLMNEFQTRRFYQASRVAEASHSNCLSQMRTECTGGMSDVSHFTIGNISYGQTPVAGTERLQVNFTREGSTQSDHIPLSNDASRKGIKQLDYRHSDQQATSEFLYANVHTKREWPFSSHESGGNGSSVFFLDQTSYNYNGSTSGALQLNTKRCGRSFSFDCNNPEIRSRQESIHDVQAPVRALHFTCSNSGLMSPSMPSSITIPQADSTSYGSSFISSWRKPATSISNETLAIQTLPCCSGSSNPSNEMLSSKIDAQIHIPCEWWQYGRNLTTSQESGFGVHRTNGFHHGFRPDSHFVLHSKVVSGGPDQTDDSNEGLHDYTSGSCVKGFASRDLKTRTNININQVFPSGIEDVEDKYDKLSVGSSCLGKKISCNLSVGLNEHVSKVAFSFSSGQLQLNSRSDAVAPDIGRKVEKELDYSLCNLQEVTPSCQFKDHKMQGNEVSENNGKKILRLFVHDKNQQINMSVSVGHMEKHLTDNTKIMKNDDMTFTDLGCDPKVLKSQTDIHVGDSVTETCHGECKASVRNHIDLNVELACTDYPISSVKLPQGEIVVQSSHCIPSFGAKIASNIDLEAPISQYEMGIINKQRYIPLSEKDGSKEKDYSVDAQIRLAAENLVAISIDCNECLPGFDTLSWFADVVSCSAENPMLLGNVGDGGTKSSNDDDFDLFEAMTLTLEEIKVDQYWSRPKELDDKDVKKDKGDAGLASLLLTKPRRGLARKRRQRKDFLRDILPGLTTLSRHEITEDLRTIGVMMQASGSPWQTALTRRTKGQNQMTCRAKGRRQPRSLAITIEEIHVNPSLHPQPGNFEVGVNDRSMIGWGRITRRPRRQRCPLGSLPLPLT